MKRSIPGVIKNISFSMLSSIISMVISAVVVLIVPRQMSTAGYGYYQLYILYTGYAGFFHFGLIDGIYIRYGGAYYDQLDHKKLFSQNCILWGYQLIIFLIICVISFSFSKEERLFVLVLSGVEMVLANTRGLLTYVLQATNRIKEGAISSTLGRVVFFIAVLVICFSGNVDFKYIILADIAGRIVALLYSSFRCREVVFRKKSDFSYDPYETKENIRVGFTLMLSSIASLLIMGIIRMCMENKWGIETFAKVSLTVSVSNLMVQFISAAALVFFPVLRRLGKGFIERIYSSVRQTFMPLLYTSMLLYYPVSRLLIIWLPKYEAGLQYMALLFPICIYEGRMSLLNYTFLKTVSDIKSIFKANTAAMIVSLICSVVSVYIIGSIPLTMFSLLIAISFRCYFTDYMISKKINTAFLPGFLTEITLMAGFIISAWFVKSIYGVLIYLALLSVYFFFMKGNIKQNFNEMKQIIRENRNKKGLSDG